MNDITEMLPLQTHMLKDDRDLIFRVELAQISQWKRDRSNIKVRVLQMRFTYIWDGYVAATQAGEKFKPFPLVRSWIDAEVPAWRDIHLDTVSRHELVVQIVGQIRKLFKNMEIEL